MAFGPCALKALSEQALSVIYEDHSWPSGHVR